MSEAKVFTGKVLWFNRGYGFIAPDDGGKDMFVHFQHIIDMEGFRTLKPDQIVEYEVGENERGPMAVNVRVIKEAPLR
jgi:cold shock CspA family protein